jgi:hypothetical protein
MGYAESIRNLFEQVGRGGRGSLTIDDLCLSIVPELKTNSVSAGIWLFLLYLPSWLTKVEVEVEVEVDTLIFLFFKKAKLLYFKPILVKFTLNFEF